MSSSNIVNTEVGLMCANCKATIKSKERCWRCRRAPELGYQKCKEPGCSCSHQSGDGNCIFKCKECGKNWSPSTYTFHGSQDRVCQCPR